MPGFANEDEQYRYTGGIFEKAFADPELHPRMAATALVFQVRCTDPDSAITLSPLSRKLFPTSVEMLRADGREYLIG